jgi:hypothetical protein
MATVAQFNQDPNDQQGQSTGGGGQILNSTGGGGAPSGGGAPTATQARAPQSGAPNINQYLQANQGAGQQLAQGITGNVQNQAAKIGQNVNTAQNVLQGQYQPLQQNLQQGQQTIQTAFQNPQQLLDAYDASKTQASNQPLNTQQQQSLDQYNQFQKLNSGGYNPAISSYGAAAQQAQGNLQNQYQNLAQQTGAAGNEMGRFQLLQNTVGQPGYSQGQQTLDELFLQAQPGVANQLKQNLGQIGSQAQQQVQGFGNQTQAKLAALQGLSGQNQQMIKNQFGQGLSDIGQNVQQEYNTAQTQGPEQVAAYQNAFKNNQYTPEQLQALGLTQGQRTWGVDVSKAGQFAANPLSAANEGGYAQVASPEEFARYNALNQLAGGGSGQTMQQNMFGTAQAAGGYKPFNFNDQSLQNTIDARQQAVLGADFQNSLTGTEASLRNLSHGGYSDTPATTFAGQLANAKTPQQASQMIQQYITSLQNANGAGRTGLSNYTGDYSALNPFRNYYNTEFLPGATGVVGQTYSTLPTMGMGDTWKLNPSGTAVTYDPLFANTSPTHTPGQTDQNLMDLINGATMPPPTTP